MSKTGGTSPAIEDIDTVISFARKITLSAAVNT